MTKGAHLLAKCWLLVEGQTEFWFFSKIDTLYDNFLDKHNVSIIEICHAGVKPSIQAAQALGIEWVLFVDNDDPGKKYQKSALELLAPDEKQEDHIIHTSHLDFEHEFYYSGYENVYRDSLDSKDISELQKTDSTDNTSFETKLNKKAVNSQKLTLCQAIVEEIEKRGEMANIPKCFDNVFTSIAKLTKD
jgi:putative ATP-dependent endonuclease of OLD family